MNRGNRWMLIRNKSNLHWHYVIWIGYDKISLTVICNGPEISPSSKYFMAHWKQFNDAIGLMWTIEQKRLEMYGTR